MKKDPKAYLLHMRDAANAVISYSSQHTFDDFASDDWDQAAAIRNLEIIGEAANHIPTGFRQKYPEIPWQDIIDFRNVAIHNYMEVDSTIIWNIIQNDVPPLLKQLNNLLKDT